MIDIQKNTAGQTIFYLTTKTASLVLLVTDSGIVLTPYWGGRIASQDISYVLNEITRASYLADADGRKDFKLEQLPQIYPSYGYTDLRGPAFAFLYADGCNGVQREHILSARKIYSRGCTSKKIGAIIKEKGGGG